MKRFVLFGLLTFGCNCAWSAQESIIYGSNENAGKHATVNDIQLYYEVYGSGHPLVLLHGNQSSIVSFRGLIPELAKHFRVIAIDSRAQGKSTDSNKVISYSLMASDVSELMNTLDISDAYVLGWSDGGIIGLELAYRYPDQISRLIAINPNFRPGSELFHTEEEMEKPYDPDSLSENMRAILAKFRARRTQQAQTKPSEDVLRKLNDLVDDYPNFTISQLESIKTPTLVMVGDYDLIPQEHTMALFNALPHSHLAVIPGASHLFPVEKPALTIQIVVDFLKTDYYDVDPYYFMRPEAPVKE